MLFFFLSFLTSLTAKMPSPSAGISIPSRRDVRVGVVERILPGCRCKAMRGFSSFSPDLERSRRRDSLSLWSELLRRLNDMFMSELRLRLRSGADRSPSSKSLSESSPETTSVSVRDEECRLTKRRRVLGMDAVAVGALRDTGGARSFVRLVPCPEEDLRGTLRFSSSFVHVSSTFETTLVMVHGDDASMQAAPISATSKGWSQVVSS